MDDKKYKGHCTDCKHYAINIHDYPCSVCDTSFHDKFEPEKEGESDESKIYRNFKRSS